MTQTPLPPLPASHPRLEALRQRAQQRAAIHPCAIGMVFAADRLALEAAAHMADAGLARPVLIGPRDAMLRAAGEAAVDAGRFELVDTGAAAYDAALRGAALACSGALAALMKGSLHSGELLSVVVKKANGLRGGARLSHAFVFDLPRYPKLLALADCVVNIAPSLRTKQDILGNAVALLQALGIARPKVAIVTAVETVNTAIAATLDAQALVEMAQRGAWPGAIVEGPFGFDNAISAEAARIKGMRSQVAGDADLLLMPDLNAGNMLYKSFNYIGGGECAGLVLGAKVPIVLTSRTDSLQARLASVALAVLASP
jgi:phosphate acetyltransferase/phosphate butyryltransferase